MNLLCIQAFAKLFVLSFATAIAGILAYSHITKQSVYCFGGASCNALILDDRSSILGVPIAAIGLAYFLILTAVLSLGRREFLMKFEPAMMLVACAGLAVNVALLLVLRYAVRLTCSMCVCVALCNGAFGLLTLWNPQSGHFPTRHVRLVLAVTLPCLIVLIYSFCYKPINLRDSVNMAVLKASTFSDLVTEPLFSVPRGRPSIVLFTDFQCSACQKMTGEVVLAASRSTSASLCVRNLPSENHSFARNAAELFEILKGRRRAVEFVLTISNTRPRSNEEFRRAMAALNISGISRAELIRGRRIVEEDLILARKLEFLGTPIVLLVRDGSTTRFIGEAEAKRVLGQ